MAVFFVSKVYPPVASWKNQCRNGLPPDYRVAPAAIARGHFTLSHCRKLVFAKTTRLGSAPAGAAGTTVPWRWYFRTGENVASGSNIKLRCQALVLPADNASATDPRFQIDLNSGSITSTVGRYPLVDTSPDLGQLQRVTVTASGLAPNTAYEARLDVIDYCRVVALTCHEFVGESLDTSGTYVSDPRPFSLDLPITDAQHQEYVQDLHTIWSHNATHLFSLVPDTTAGVWTRTTGSYVNILDQTVSAVGANSPGFNFQTPAHNAFHTTSIPCVVAAYGSTLTGTGNLRLADSSGALVTLSISGSAAWTTGTFNLDSAAAHKVDVMFQGDGNQVNIHSVCAYMYVT